MDAAPTHRVHREKLQSRVPNTDYPFRNGAEMSSGLAGYGFSAADLRVIDRDNALRLFPKLKV